jgi:hypothetical protein
MLRVFSGFGVPLVLVTAYRLAPDRVRGMRCWPGSSGPSTSHLAVTGLWEAYHEGRSGWPAVWNAWIANGDVPGW